MVNAKAVTAGILVIGQLICSLVVVLLISLKLGVNLTSKEPLCMLSDTILSTYPCYYGYAIAAASAVVSIVIAVLQLVNVGTYSPFVDLLLSEAWLAIWLGAAGVFTWFGSQANAHGIPLSRQRNIFIFFNFFAALLSVTYFVVCTNMMIVCCQSWTPSEDDLEKGKGADPDGKKDATASRILDKDAEKQAKGKGKARSPTSDGALDIPTAAGPPSDSGVSTSNSTRSSDIPSTSSHSHSPSPPPSPPALKMASVQPIITKMVRKPDQQHHAELPRKNLAAKGSGNSWKR